METISQVEKQISLNEELLQATKKRIGETASKLSESKGNVKKIEFEIQDTKAKRQQALVKGGDTRSLSDSLKKLESESELETEKVTGLEDFLKELQQEEASLHLKLNELPKRIVQLRSLELAAQYNNLAEKMAPVVKELNEIFYKLGGNGNSKQNLVAFYPMEGAFEKLPKIFYDDAGLNLEAFVAKHPGMYHTNVVLAAEDKNFYDWNVHQNKLRNG